ncbi:hypothetical protein ACFV0R_22235 [Streptomyces sp. NPDC059578]|uniref:hypothetical protein n=1 Tax=Streptomyces sp. NPDC059578 TaxID=3346874 RepID=UPI003680F809
MSYQMREQSRQAYRARLRETREEAAVGRAAVRERARGMRLPEVVAILDGLRAGPPIEPGSRTSAEWAEWRRIKDVLDWGVDTYDPDTDPHVQAEDAAQAALDADRQAADRLDELEALALTGQLHTVQPQDGDDRLHRQLHARSWDAGQAVDGWLAQALATQTGCYADPAALDAALARLPENVTARAELLAALAATGTPVRDEELPFAGRLAAADPDAVTDLAHWLTTALADHARGTDGGTP